MFLFIKTLKTSSFGLRLREFRYRFILKKIYPNMLYAIERYSKTDNKKPASLIRKEIKICKDYWHCYPHHYFRYDLYKNEIKLSRKELIDYIPEFFFYYLFLPFYNLEKYEILLKDKIITEQLFKSLEIPQPVTLAKLLNNQLYDSLFKSLKFTTLINKIENQQPKKIFVKPNDGFGGHGIYIFNAEKDDRYCSNDKMIFNEEFLKEISKKNDYIIQPGIEQEHEITKIYPYSINTFRIATSCRNNRTKILCATLRLGMNKNQLDNISQGGIFIVIDTDNGFLGDYATNHYSDIFCSHPNTGFKFKGYKLKQWSRIKEFVQRCASKLPQFVYLGWDIALSTEGPIAIEANTDFGLDHFQRSSGGLRELFEIDNPDYYWKNKSNG